MSNTGCARLAAAVVLAALAAPAAAARQAAQAPPPTGLIVGTVIDGDRHTPLTNVVVSLSGPGTAARRVLVDPHGRFLFDGLGAGAFTLTAAKAGYLAGAYGRLRPDGLGGSLDLQPGERVTDAKISLWRFSSIAGTVLDDAGDPVPNATVQIWRRAIFAGRWRLVNTGTSAGTDDRGVYRVTGLEPGTYAEVITSLTSAIPMSLLLASEAARTAEGAASADFTRAAQTGGTMGYVSDLSQRFPTVRSGNLLLQMNGTSAPTSDNAASIEIYPPVWYPAAPTSATAALITLGTGENRDGIDIHTTLTRTVHISGTVTGPNGPVPFLSLRLVPAGLDDVAAEVSTSLSQSFNAAMTATDADGAFTFVAAPGQYLLRAMTNAPPVPEPPAPATTVRTADGMSHSVSGPRLAPMLGKEPTFWASQPIAAGDTDVANVAVVMRPALHVTGRVVFTGATAAPAGTALRGIKIAVEPADGHTVWYPTTYLAQVDPNGEFYTPGLMPGSYVLRVDSAPRGWTITSAIVGGHDICDTPLVLDADDVSGLVITFTDRPSGITGSVRDAQGRADATAAVLVFPRDGAWTNLGSSPRRLQSVRASRTGAFTISALPPGDYDIVAIDDAMTSNWQDPAFLRTLDGVAHHFSLGDGEHPSIDLTTTAVVR